MKVKTILKDGKQLPAPAHQVPLSRQALALLESIRPADAKPGDLIFPGDKPGQMLSINTMNFMLRRIRRNATPHGMRATFSTWRAEKAPQFDWRLAEAALAHSFKTDVEGAYNRSNLLDQRRDLMQHWADYLES
jgi:integrase